MSSFAKKLQIGKLVNDQNIRVMGRATQGVRLIKLNDDDKISSVAKIEIIDDENKE